MVGHEALMAFAQRQHLGALQEAPHALGVFLLVHLSTLSFAPPSCGGRKSGPSQRHPDADMGRDCALQDQTAGEAIRQGGAATALRTRSISGPDLTMFEYGPAAFQLAIVLRVSGLHAGGSSRLVSDENARRRLPSGVISQNISLRCSAAAATRA